MDTAAISKAATETAIGHFFRPGLEAIVTGGSPALTGIYYDVAYSRNYNAPAQTTGNSLDTHPRIHIHHQRPLLHHHRVHLQRAERQRIARRRD